MSEVEEYPVEPTEKTEAAPVESEEPEEVIDLNARLLEVMVERTELLERLLKGAMDLATLREKLEKVKVPSLEKRRRRKKST